MSIFVKFGLGLAVAIVAVSGAAAQDAYSYGPSTFEGFYAGVYGGGAINPGTAGTLGGAVGANFSVTEQVLAGAEIQGGATFGTTTTYDALALARAGALVTDQVFAYGAVGGGWDNSVGVWAVGGGVEAEVVDSVGIRGEVLGTGAWGGGLNKTRASVGVLYHVK